MPRQSIPQRVGESNKTVMNRYVSLRYGNILALLLGCSAAAGNEIDRYLPEGTIDLARDYNKLLRNAPNTVEIITREDMDRWGALTVAEAIEHIVGIHVRVQPDGRHRRLMVRGIDSNYVLLHDGAQIDSVLRDISAIPLAGVKHIEVLKGSHFAIYAANALSGTINIVSYGPGDEGTLGGALAGQQATQGAWVRHARRHDKIGYSAFASHYQSDVNNDVIRSDRQTGLDEQLGTNISLAPAKGYFDVEVSEASVELEFEENFSWKHIVYDRRKGLGVGLVQALDPVGQERIFSYSSDMRYKRPVSWGEIDLKLLYKYVDGAYDDARLFPEGALFGQFPDGVLQSFAQKGTDLSIEAFASYELDDHTLRIGAGARTVETSLDYDRRNYTIQPGDALPTSTGDIVEFDGADALFRELDEERSVHLVLRDEWSYSNDVTINLGIRLDDSTLTSTKINPRISAEWSVSLHTNLIALYGESTQVPNLTELSSNGLFGARGNPRLENSQLRMFELKLEHAWQRDIETSINVYAYSQDDLIGVVSNPESPNGLEFANLDDCSSGQGLELLSTWNVNRQVDLRAGLALQGNDTADTSGQRAARSQLYLQLNHDSTSGWNTNLTLFGLFDRDRSRGDDRPELDDYLVTNLVIRRDDVLPGFDLSFAFQNVFDENAREDASTSIEDDVRVFPRRLLVSAEYGF